MSESDKTGAIWLRAESGWAIVCIEWKGKWIEVCRESLSSPFSHITEPAGIEDRIKNIDPDAVKVLEQLARYQFSGRNFPHHKL